MRKPFRPISKVSCDARDDFTLKPNLLEVFCFQNAMFGRVRDRLNPDEVGGAPLLGVNGVVVIGHGRSNAYAVKQAVGQARRAAEQGIVDAIRDGIAARQAPA